MNGPTISNRSLALVGTALLLLVVTAALVSTGVGGESGTLAAADFGELLIVGLAAAVIIQTALSIGLKTRPGLTWLLVGLGAASYAVGDAVWTFIEIGQGLEVPYPGLPDLFYLLEYPLVATGVIVAGRAFKGLVDLRRPALVAGAVGTALAATVYALLIRPSVWIEGVSTGERVLSSLYPLADVLLMIAPALFVVGVVRQLGGGRLAGPWWSVALGALFIALSDVGYAWLSAADAYQSGSFIDYGWSLGHIFIMLGALVVADMGARSSRQ